MKYPLNIFVSCFIVIVYSCGLSATARSISPPIDSTFQECTQPVSWRVGSIDPRFEMDTKTLKHLMNDVQNLWSDAVNTTLIEYSDSGKVAINLIYSDDQKFTDNEQAFSERINKMRKKYDAIKMEYQIESGESQKKPISNSQPFLEYEEKVNEYIFQYNSRFNQMRTFRNAVYINIGDRKEVNIYQFENIDKLRLVLAHEFGHVLGLSHAQNPISIMYHRMRLQNDKVLKLTGEDIQAIQNRCGP